MSLLTCTVLYTTVLHYRPLFQRVLAMTNHHTGMSLQAPGQEDFTIIQYNPDDQYTYALTLLLLCCCSTVSVLYMYLLHPHCCVLIHLYCSTQIAYITLLLKYAHTDLTATATATIPCT